MASDDDSKKVNLLVELRLVIDRDLTWGELLDFVATAQQHGLVDRDETVDFDSGPTGEVALLAWLDPAVVKPPNS